MDVTKCDRCGKYIDKPSTMVPHVAYKKDLSCNRSPETVSICNGCYESFQRWLNALQKPEGKIEDEEESENKE